MKKTTPSQKEITLERARNLQRQRSHLAGLSPEKALDYIVDAPEPAALVHSLPEEDFYFLTHDIGPEDALPLLSLASDTQLEYILDLEAWHQDRIQVPVLTKWLALMMQAQPFRLVPWLVEKKPAFTEFYLHKNIQVVIREHDEDPSDFGDDFFTLDDVFYVRILRSPIPIDGEGPIEDGERRRLTFLKRLLSRIADHDHVHYQGLLMRAAGVLSAEAEEDLYRTKNVRLAEKGFLPFDEAIGVYQALAPKDIFAQPPKPFENTKDTSSLLPVPQYAAGMVPGQSVFSDALRLVQSADHLQQIQMEFATLSNRVIVADGKPVTDKNQLTEIVRKVCGYLSIGIEALHRSTDERRSDELPAHGAAYISRFPLSQIFRVGYGRALHLKWKIQRWQQKAWYTSAGLPLTFWGERWMGVLGGIMIKKPLFFDNYETGHLYRNFETMAEITATDETIEQIMAMDALLSRIKINFPQDSEQLLTYKNLVLTLWARHAIQLPEKPDSGQSVAPLSREQFQQFFKRLFNIESNTPSQPPRKTTKGMKASFLDWLSKKANQNAEDLTGRIGSCLDALFEELDTELGAVAPTDIDPRFISLFLIQA